MAVLKYFDKDTNNWEPLSVLSSGTNDIADLKITDDYLHLITKAGNKVGKGVDTADIAGTAAKLDTKIVSELPTSDISATTIYMVLDPSAPDTDNTYNEYIYVNKRWERIDATANETDVDQIPDFNIDSLF